MKKYWIVLLFIGLIACNKDSTNNLSPATEKTSCWTCHTESTTTSYYPGIQVDQQHDENDFTSCGWTESQIRKVEQENTWDKTETDGENSIHYVSTTKCIRQ